MSNNFGMFLLLSIFATGLITAPLAFAQETVNATETTEMTESSNSTSTETTEMTESSNSTSPEGETMVVEDELEIELETEDEMTETENTMAPVILSPLKQIKDGILPENVVCNEGLNLVFKINGQPACIQTASIEKLVAWGWAQ
ncbi:MAG: hypothetical protein RI100_05065 [Nitrosarchaeum sp.]|jgi:hypothetical protein|uniref:hypothetical protein n=1 Tax=Nitrosarchaeum sp. TaxID=2026886 RepID=UPI002DEDD210|nr:hypothetical protein [Nitrosarchaeum sp.]